jgi:hypothetical protein
MEPIVIIESPYSAATANKLIVNQEYLKAAIKDSIDRGEAPFAGHFLYTRVLNDRSPQHRFLGMRISRAFLRVASLVAVYEDMGLSPGMLEGIRLAKAYGVPLDYRKIDEWPELYAQLTSPSNPLRPTR